MSRLRSSVHLVAANLLAAAIAFVSVRFFMRWLDEDRTASYSVYLYIVTVWGFVALFCPDIASGAQKRMTEHLAAGRKDLAVMVQRVQIGATLANVVLALILGVVFGMFFPLPEKAGAVRSLLALFVLSSVGFSFRALTGVATSLLSASEKFGAIAVRQSLETLSAATVALVLAYYWRTPVSLVLGATIGAGVGLAVSVWYLRKGMREFSCRPAFHWPTLADLLVLSVKTFPHSLANQMASGLDRAIIAWAGVPLTMVARYAVPYRLPETLAGLLSPAIDTVVPELTRKASAGPGEFAEAIDRYGRQALLVGTACILVPAGWGGPFLKLWLAEDAPEGGAVVVLLIGLYFSLNFYFSTLTRAFRATGNMHFVFPFSAFNGLVTLAVTVLAIRWMGIGGVAAMNACINLVQVVPFAFFMRPAATPEFPSGAHAAKALAMLAVGAAFAYSGFWVSNTAFVMDRPWLCILLAPVWVAAAGVLLPALRLAPVPQGLLRFVPARFRG